MNIKTNELLLLSGNDIPFVEAAVTPKTRAIVGPIIGTISNKPAITPNSNA